MKKFLIVVLVLGALVLILYFLSLEPSTSAEDFRAASNVYLEILKMRQSDPIPFDEMEKAFHKGPHWVVSWVDDHEDLKLTEKIQEAIAYGAKGDIPKINGQIVDKTIQRAFFLRIAAELKSLSEGVGKSEESVDKIRGLYVALEPTVVRRSEWIEAGSALPDRVNLLLDEIAKNADSPSEKLTKSIDDYLTLMRGVFVLSVLYEVDGIDNYRGSDRMKAIEKMAEAKLYYEIFFPEHAEKNREAAILVMGEFIQTPEVIDTDMIRQELQQAFLGLIPELTVDRFERSH